MRLQSRLAASAAAPFRPAARAMHSFCGLQSYGLRSPSPPRPAACATGAATTRSEMVTTEMRFFIALSLPVRRRPRARYSTWVSRPPDAKGREDHIGKGMQRVPVVGAFTERNVHAGAAGVAE